MALSDEEQQLVEHARGAVPRWLWGRGGSFRELWNAFAKVFDQARQTIAAWLRQTFIKDAEDIWLDEHAKDQGTSRQADENDESLRERLRRPEEAVIRRAILERVNAILAANGINDEAVTYNLRQHRGFFGTYASPSGTCEEFTKDGDTMTLQVAGADLRGKYKGQPITIAGATSAGNDGTFEITGFPTDDSLTYENPDGVAEAGAGTWAIWADRDGKTRAYFGRGYRMGKSRSALVLILPYPTSEATRLAVKEALRLKKAAGYLAVVERPHNAP